MKGGKPQTKEKAAAKKSAMENKDSALTTSSEEAVLQITAERRTNKHYYYLKAQKDPKTGKVGVVTTKGEDAFYLGSFDKDVTLFLVNQMLQMYLREGDNTDAKIIKANAAMAPSAKSILRTLLS